MACLGLCACGVSAPAPILKGGEPIEDPSIRADVPAPSEDLAESDLVIPDHGPTPIVFDGLFDDWGEVSFIVEDPKGDAGPSGIELTTLGIADDGDQLYLDLDVGTEIELDWGHGLSLYLRCDEGEREIRWDPGLRSGLQTEGAQEMELYFTDIGFIAAPVTTATRFEITLDLEALSIHLGDCARDLLRLRLEDRAVEGDALPDAGWVHYPLSVGAVPAPAMPSLERVPGTLRIVTWNILWGGLGDPELIPQFRRVFQALNPDVIALQEIYEHDEAHQLVLDWFPEEWWEYAGFGNAVTLSRFPRNWGWPGSYDPLDGRFTVAGFETPDAGMFVVFNAHLSFGDQDAERQWEADSFIAYLRDLQTPGGLVDMPEGTPFILVGDLNLVGDRAQLDTLLTGAIHDTETFGPPHAPDWDGSPLQDRFALHAGRDAAWTWRSWGGGYWPGKLDYTILPDSVVSVANEFVLDTTILSDDVLEELGLERHDTEASDHLPVVVDLILPAAP